MRSDSVRQAGLLTVAVLVLGASGLSAQQAVPVATPQDSSRSQIEGFERSLLGAIDSAAGRLSERVRQVFPDLNVQLRYQAQPLANGVLIPETGAIFHVLIPAIQDVDLKVVAMNAARRSLERPVALTTPTVPPMTDPNGEYTGFVKEALYDAILDHGLTLPLVPGQQLMVIAGELTTDPPSPFNQKSRMLILQMKSEDLIAFRNAQINRDEARARIKESRFPN